MMTQPKTQLSYLYAYQESERFASCVSGFLYNIQSNFSGTKHTGKQIKNTVKSVLSGHPGDQKLVAV
jgi:hypothetical protein